MKIKTFVAVALTTALGTIVQASQGPTFTFTFNSEEVKCLAQNIYFEARAESTLGQTAVAWVTLNRVEDSKYPMSICDVVWEKGQFSWTHDGKSDRPKDKEAWNKAKYVAYQVLRNREVQPDPTEGAIMFHAVYVEPYWIENYERVVRIDDHIFYKN